MRENDEFKIITIIKLHSWKTSWNSLHIVSFRCLAFVWVNWPLEKSKTSSLRRPKIRLIIQTINTIQKLTLTTLKSPYYFDILTRLFLMLQQCH